MPFERFIQIDADGTVIQTGMGRTVPEGWIRITRGQHPMLGLEPLSRLRYSSGRLREKKRCRLTVGAYTFPADGETPVAIGVRGGKARHIRVLINGEAHIIEEHDDLMLTSEEPGRYVIRVDDPRYYAVPAEQIITAVRPDVEDQG